LLRRVTQTATTAVPLGVIVTATPKPVFAREFTVTIKILVFYWAFMHSLSNFILT
jgi:hypothetical protein